MQDVHSMHEWNDVTQLMHDTSNLSLWKWMIENLRQIAARSIFYNKTDVFLGMEVPKNIWRLPLIPLSTSKKMLTCNLSFLKIFDDLECHNTHGFTLSNKINPAKTACSKNLAKFEILKRPVDSAIFEILHCPIPRQNIKDGIIVKPEYISWITVARIHNLSQQRKWILFTLMLIWAIPLLRSLMQIADFFDPMRTLTRYKVSTSMK